MAYLDDMIMAKSAPLPLPSIDPRADLEMDQFPRLSAYSKHLETIPQEAQYKPKVLDRIAASMAGFSEGGLRGGGAGVETATNILRAPFGRALEEYSRKGQGLEAGADIESQLYNRQQQLGNTRFKQLMDMLHQQTEASRAADYSRSIDYQGQKTDFYGNLVGARSKLAEAQATAAEQNAASREFDAETRAKRARDLKAHYLSLGDKWNADRVQRAFEASERLKAYKERTSKIGEKGNKERFVTPRDQATIEGLALKEIRMTRPELYEEFVQTEGEGNKAIARVMPPVEEAPGMLYNWTGLGSPGVTGDALTEKQNRFKEFQKLLQTHKQSALGRSGLSTAGYGSLKMPGVISEDKDVALEEDEDEEE